MRKVENKKIFFVLLFFAVLIAFSGCKSKKQIVADYTPIEDKKNAQLFLDILDNAFAYNTLSSKLNLNISSGTRSISSRASLRMIKDNAMQISIQPLFGVEMFRIYITPDTLIVLDRMNKQYMQESISDLKKTYPVGFDFQTLQSLFTNQLFVSGKEEVLPSDFTAFRFEKPSDLHYRLKATDKISAIDYSFTINGNDRVSFAHLVEPQKKYSLQWQYGNFEMVQNQTFPSQMNVLVESPSRKMSVGLDFSEIKKDESFSLSMKIPTGYSKRTMDDILRILTSIR